MLNYLYDKPRRADASQDQSSIGVQWKAGMIQGSGQWLDPRPFVRRILLHLRAPYLQREPSRSASVSFSGDKRTYAGDHQKLPEKEEGAKQLLLKIRQLQAIQMSVRRKGKTPTARMRSLPISSCRSIAEPMKDHLNTPLHSHASSALHEGSRVVLIVRPQGYQIFVPGHPSQGGCSS